MPSARASELSPRQISISTDRAPRSERLNYFHEHFAAVWGSVSTQLIRGVPFSATLTSTPLGLLRLNRITASGWRFSKPSSGQGFFSLAFPVSGAAAARLGGRSMELSAGHIYLLDNRESGGFSTYPSYGTCNVQIPAALLEPRFQPTTPMVRVPLAPGDGGAAVLRDYVAALLANAQQIAESDAPLFVRQLCELVAFMVDGAEGLQSEDSSVVSAHRRRVMAFIAVHYDDNDLSPEVIAAACGVSRSYLHHIFHRSNDSVMRRVRAVRLRRAKELLEDPLARDQSVAEVCYRVGFTSAAEFSRVFKRAFGVSPRDVRVTRREHLEHTRRD